MIEIEKALKLSIHKMWEQIRIRQNYLSHNATYDNNMKLLTEIESLRTQIHYSYGKVGTYLYY